MDPYVVTEKIYENVVLTDRTGRVIWNAGQQDSPAVRRVYSDGSIDFVDQRTGKLILPRSEPMEAVIPRCQKCGEEPW